MQSKNRQPAPKGSFRWATRVAEMTAWATALIVVIVLQIGDLDPGVYRAGMVVIGGLAIWLIALFRFLLPRLGDRKWMLSVSLAITLAFAAGIYGLLRGEVASVQLVFVPVVFAAGILGRVREALAVPALAIACYWGIGELVGLPPSPGAVALNGGLLIMSGAVAGVLSRELRAHYRAEREEHRLATAVRHRLMAVLDAVDEAIVFSDRSGIVRLVNRRAADLFEIEADKHLGLPVVQLQRTLARKTEDPEGFMEAFQQLRDDPETELRESVEQIIPDRRQLRLYSGPALDDTGVLVGRIDVYTDVTEAVRRAAEVERLYERARTTAESFQKILLPRAIPSLPRISLVAHYVPAAGRKAVCGDFYDFVQLPDGRLAVVMGDVCGIGPDAVGDAALTRYSLTSLASQHQEPAALLAHLNSHVSSHISPDRFVRLLIGVLDPERAVFEYANAGHVPPVVHRAKSGEVEWLGEGGIALGVEEDADYKIGRAELEPGDMLVLYTDGITEAPRFGRPFGQGRFVDLVKAYGVGTPGELSQAIRRSVATWVEDGELRDDLAVLVCQVVPDATIGEPTRDLVLPNESARLSDIRRFVSSFLTDVRAPVDVSTEIQLAVGEATGNACRHGRKENGWSEIRVRASLKEDVVTIEIADDGPGFDPEQVRERLPDKFASGGRGLFLMRTLMDEVEIQPGPGGTTVSMSRSLVER